MLTKKSTRRFTAVALATLALTASAGIAAGSADAAAGAPGPGGPGGHKFAAVKVEVRVLGDPTCNSLASCNHLISSCITFGFDFGVSAVDQFGRPVGGGCVERDD
jgi:hypothetical protein